jgi:hypothetical protein
MGITKKTDRDGNEFYQIVGRCYMRLRQLQDEFDAIGRKTSLVFLDMCEGTCLLTVSI